jgi:type III secretion protein U
MSDEKTEKPTDKKLDDAKRDGEAAKSTDLTSSAVLLSGVVLMAIGGPFFGDSLRALMSFALDASAYRDPELDLHEYMKKLALQGAMLLLPFLGVVVTAAVIGIWGQTGMMLSFKPMELKFNSINPASGLKRIFSMRSMIDILKMVFKAAVICSVMWKILLTLAATLVAVAYEPVLDIIQISWQALTKFISIGGGLFLILGAVDFGIQRWLFIRDHRMSKDDIKREYKNSEGDPHLKGKRKSVAKEMVETAPPKPTKEGVGRAQAVIVNPTHYAVAIRYDPKEFGLPRVVAKGTDDDALLIRRIAQELGIPVVGNPPLARALHTVPLEHAIPEVLFETVAVILKWVKDIGSHNADATSPSSSSYLVDPL